MIHSTLVLAASCNRPCSSANVPACMPTSSFVYTFAVQRDKREAGQQVLAITAGGEKGASAPAWSCLDGLWEALRKGAELRAGQPAVLAQAVRALLGMWQVQPPPFSVNTASPVCMSTSSWVCSRWCRIAGEAISDTWRLCAYWHAATFPRGMIGWLPFQAGPMAWRATEILRRQPDFWQRLASCLPDAAQRSLALTPAAAASAQDEEGEAGEEAVQEWLRKGDSAWRLSAESSALQLLALEVFASPPGQGDTHPPQRYILFTHRPRMV